MKYKKYLPIIIALLFIAGVANAQSVTFWKYLNGDVLPVIGTWGLRFDGEIKPDGATCSNGQILKKTGTDDWDCAADDSGSSDPFTHTTNYNQTVSATNTPIWHQAGLMASSTSYLVNASSTMQTITDAFWLPFHTAAILLTDAAGKIAEYTGTTCTNQFVRALSALGVATCESVNLASDVTGDLPFANLTQVAANSVLGNPTGSTGDAQSIATTTWNVGVLNALTSMGNGTSTFSGAVQIGSTAGDNAFLMTAGRNYGTGASTGGMVSLSNTNNTSAALNVYTNAGAGQSSLGLVFMKQDNALGDGTILRMDNDGVDNSLVINHNNTTTTLAPIDITNAGLTPGIQITATNASNSQGAVRIDSATPEIEMSEDDCPEGRGNCDAEWRLNNEIAQINSRNNADDSFEKGFGFSSTRQGGALQLVRPNASGDAEYGLFNSRIGIIGINTATTTNYLSISSATDGGGYEGTPLDDILVIPGSSGNLGIGTSSPSQKLTVHGAGSALQTLNCTVAGGSCWTQFSEKSVIRGYLGYSSVGGLATGITAGDMVLRTGAAFHVAGASTPRLTVLNAGNTGVGSTTPWGDFSIEMDTTNPAFVVSNTGSSTPSLVVTGVNQNGYVGVGSSTPWRTFSVTGTMANTGMTSATGGTNNSICITAGGDFVNETTGTCVVSSRKFKDNINPLNLKALDMINSLRTVSFTMKDDKDKKLKYGFIAEEADEADTRLALRGSQGEVRSLDDHAFLAVLWKGVQEQQEQIENITIGKVKESAQDKWQYLLILILFTWNIALTIKKK